MASAAEMAAAFDAQLSAESHGCSALPYSWAALPASTGCFDGSITTKAVAWAGQR
jgi:hypothetical protein